MGFGPSLEISAKNSSDKLRFDRVSNEEVLARVNNNCRIIDQLLLCVWGNGWDACTSDER